MQRLAFFLLLIICSSFSLNAQGKVSFLNNNPVIDGFADESVLLNLTSFKHTQKSNASNPDIEARYHLSYNSTHLYVYIEAAADEIFVRDRGYQNGDGFHMVIGKVEERLSPTDEFYVLGFSAENTWGRKICWYYNKDLAFKSYRDEVKFETGKRDGKISFELLLPWHKVYPYNPLLSDEIGFNLCFVKAIENSEKNYYYIVEDDKMQSEQAQRKYERLNFEIPTQSGLQIASNLSKNNFQEGESPFIRLAAITDRDTMVTISTSIYSGENTRVAVRNTSVDFTPGLSENSIELENLYLPAGGYKIEVSYNDQLIDENHFSVFSSTSTNQLKSTLQGMERSIDRGTYNTLMFYLEDIDTSLKNLKSYETSFNIRQRMNEMGIYIEGLQNGKDLLANKTGTFRRAYQSETDQEYKPYSIFVPKDYDENKKYPLLVYLHGSGDDDRVLGRTRIPDDFIVLAPNGRDVSNCFASAEAQTDIEEAIGDVITNYQVDPSKIILSGFSMGGYGVYRTFYEQPARYSAIAVLSGHPNLAQEWIGKNETSFLDPRNLKNFRNIPVYIYHGTQDLNCPYEYTVDVVKELKKKNPNLTFETEEGGHGSMNSDIQHSYFSWLRKQAGI